MKKQPRTITIPKTKTIVPTLAGIARDAMSSLIKEEKPEDIPKIVTQESKWLMSQVLDHEVLEPIKIWWEHQNLLLTYYSKYETVEWKTEKEFHDYFDQCTEYPGHEISEGVLMPHDHLYSYISVDFLSAWINFVEIKSAMMVVRHSVDENISSEEELSTWLKSIKERFTHATNGQNTSFREFPDDVMILAKSGSCWWYFYFDHDVSDCEIGRFLTDDSPHLVQALFKEMVVEKSRENLTLSIALSEFPEDMDVDSIATWSIPLSSLNGWKGWS